MLLIVGFCALWELAIRAEWLPVYLYGQPSGIGRELWKGLAEGKLLRDAWVTAEETVLGFLIGSIAGSAAGLLLRLSPTTAAVLRPIMVALNGLPKIALAPPIVVWFGIGLDRPGRVKATHAAEIPGEMRHPLRIRTLPRYAELFETIWTELGIDLAA
ncbi:ABC transporter permease [Belnapia rosea]|uniref:ABC transporter permease n=1 Tax=Belnapia rosea TaxID=938405 RepID=UPI00088B069F|nr:hypothetical protein [Belnapia rosea]SDB70750.1 NitT/TauT family transport system permease protein [Belnapia rosea]